MSDNRCTRPLIRYYGGKWKIAPWIISHFPTHKVYVEPFGGGASVLLRKDRSKHEIYNDLSDELVNLFRVLRDNGDQLKRAIELTPYARSEFVASLEDTDDPVERARRYIVFSAMGFATRGKKENAGFRSKIHPRKTGFPESWDKYKSHIDKIIERMQGVVIENLPAIDLIKKYDTSDTLYYVDPPYVPSTRTSNVKYQHEMTEDDHRELADVLNNVKGMVIVSGYDSDLYHRLYQGWETDRKLSETSACTMRDEVLWINQHAVDRLNATNQPLVGMMEGATA